MSTSMKDLKNALAGLSSEERADLAQFLIESLDDPMAVDSTSDAYWKHEVSQRVASIHAGTADGTPAEEVLERLRRK